MSKVRDKLWMWGHAAGSHTTPKACRLWQIPGRSTIAPADAATCMGIPNGVMVVFNNRPEPPFDECAEALAPLKKVVWSIVGDASSTRNDRASDIDEVLRLAERFPNITGGIMDDFFRGRGGDATPRHPLKAITGFRDRLHGAGRGLDLWAVLYHSQLHGSVAPHLEQCDVVTFWTMSGRELAELERNFDRLLELTPDGRRVLGCYMWNYGEKGPMPIELMRHQCELGLTWLKGGLIDGMIFLASCICDLGLDAVEWTRDWIREVGDEPIENR